MGAFELERAGSWKKPGHNGKYSKKRGEMECRSRVMMAIEQQLAQMDATSENGPRTSGDLFFCSVRRRGRKGKGRSKCSFFSPFMSVFDCATTKKGGKVKVGYI